MSVQLPPKYIALGHATGENGSGAPTKNKTTPSVSPRVKAAVVLVLGGGILFYFASFFLVSNESFQGSEIWNNIKYNNIWEYNHFAKGVLYYCVTQRLDWTLIACYAYESLYGMFKITTLRGHGVWDEDKQREWLIYTHFDTLITDILMGFIGALFALALFKMFSPTRSLLTAEYPSQNHTGFFRNLFTFPGFLRTVFVSLLVMSADGQSEFRSIIKPVAYIVVVCLVKRGSRFLRTHLGYADDTQVVQYIFNYLMLLVIYLHHRFALRPFRWTSELLRSEDESSSSALFDLDLQDQRSFVGYTLAAAVVFVATVYFVRTIYYKGPPAV